MAVQFLLRKDRTHSPFREALGQLMSTDGDELILTTGYITNSLLNIYNHSDFVEKIAIGFNSLEYDAVAKVVIIGGMFEYSGKPNISNMLEFEGIVKYLSTLYNVTYYVPKNKRWHAKIAIKVRNNLPLIALIGSSNLTAPCFSVYPKSSTYSINHESDILIWNGSEIPGVKGVKSSFTDKDEIITYMDDLTIQLISVIKDFTDNINLDKIKSLLKYPSELYDYLISTYKDHEDPSLQSYFWDVCYILSQCINFLDNNSKNKIYFYDVLPLRSSRIGLQYTLNNILTSLQAVYPLCEKHSSSEITHTWFIVEENRCFTKELLDYFKCCRIFSLKKSNLLKMINELGGFYALTCLTNGSYYEQVLSSYNIETDYFINIIKSYAHDYPISTFKKILDKYTSITEPLQTNINRFL